MHKPVVFMHHNPMGAHVTPPNRLRKLSVKDNSTRNEEAAVLFTSGSVCCYVVIFVFTYGRDAGNKYLEKVGRRIREERLTPRPII